MPRYRIILICLAAGLVCSGCSQKAPETVIVNQTVTIVRTATAAKPATTPKLNSVLVNLTVTAPNEYAAYSLPVYLTTEQTLHLSWKSDGGGFQMNLVNPGGEVSGLGQEGVTAQESEAELDFIGGLNFSPADYEGPAWSNGFYYFVPTIYKGSGAVKISISYWMEAYYPTSNLTQSPPSLSASTSKPPAT